MARRPRDTSWPPVPDPLSHPLVDNHTHLEAVLAGTDARGWLPSGDDGAGSGAAADGAGARLTTDDHLARAAEVGVTHAVQIGCDLPAIDWTVRAIAVHDRLVGGVAIHPNEAVRHARVHEVGPDGLEPRPEPHHAVPLNDAVARVAEVARTDPRIRVIGETGLDHFRAGPRGRAVQREAFRAHVALAKELGLVLQIHDRDAHAEVLEVLAADGAPERTVFHCFSGDAAMARHCVAQGWYLSFAGSVTFSSAHDLRAALHEVPASRLLLESDAPYLAPHPHRGRPNAPYLVAATARAVAAELEADVTALTATVWQTSQELYGPW